MRYKAFGAWQSHQIPAHSLHDGEGSSVPDMVPFNDTVNSESALGTKPGDSGVVMSIRLMSLLVPGV